MRDAKGRLCSAPIAAIAHTIARGVTVEQVLGE